VLVHLETLLSLGLAYETELKLYGIARRQSRFMILLWEGFLSVQIPVAPGRLWQRPGERREGVLGAMYHWRSCWVYRLV